MIFLQLCIFLAVFAAATASTNCCWWIVCLFNPIPRFVPFFVQTLKGSTFILQCFQPSCVHCCVFGHITHFLTLCHCKIFLVDCCIFWHTLQCCLFPAKLQFCTFTVLSSSHGWMSCFFILLFELSGTHSLPVNGNTVIQNGNCLIVVHQFLKHCHWDDAAAAVAASANNGMRAILASWDKVKKWLQQSLSHTLLYECIRSSCLLNFYCRGLPFPGGKRKLTKISSFLTSWSFWQWFTKIYDLNQLKKLSKNSLEW